MSNTLENVVVEVFGTKQVSVKEFMGSSDKSLVLLSDYEKAKQNLEALKEKHEARVDELVVVEKLSPEELKELNGIRAELREPRYLIQNIEKNNISVFESYKKTDKANLKGLIEINNALEDKATEKLQIEEKRKKDEKEAEAKAEEVRVEKIKTDIDNIETYCYQVIQKMTFDNLKTSTELVDQSLNAENDFEEYDLLLDQVKGRVAKLLLEKTNDITARENQRVENEAMKKEIFEVRINRLKEVGFEFKDGVFTNSDSIHNYTKEQIVESSSLLFEQYLNSIKHEREQAEQSKRDAELKKQKDEQFEIRKNRLAEIGFEYKGGKYFYFKINPNGDTDATIEVTLIEDTDANNFEQRLKNAKLLIEDIIKQKEIAEQKAKEAEELALKQKEEADKKLAAEKKKADAENKARVKRLASDKESLKNFIDGLEFNEGFNDIENEECQTFVNLIIDKVSELKADLLTQLNEL